MAIPINLLLVGIFLEWYQSSLVCDPITIHNPKNVCEDSSSISLTFWEEKNITKGSVVLCSDIECVDVPERVW